MVHSRTSSAPAARAEAAGFHSSRGLLSLLSRCGSLVLQFLRLSVQTSRLIALQSGGASSALELTCGCWSFPCLCAGKTAAGQTGSSDENCRAAVLGLVEGRKRCVKWVGHAWAVAVETPSVSVTAVAGRGAGCGTLLGSGASSCLHTVRYVFFLFWSVLLQIHVFLQPFGENQPPRHGFVTSRAGCSLMPLNTFRKFSFFIFKVLLFCMMFMHVYRNFS